MSKQESGLLKIMKEIAIEKDISITDIHNILLDAFLKTYKRSRPDEDVAFQIDLENGNIVVSEKYKVVSDDLHDSDDFDDTIQMLHKDALVFDPKIKVNDTLTIHPSVQDVFTPYEVAQILQLLKQRTTELHNKKVSQYWEPMINTVVYAKVVEVSQHNEHINGYHVQLEDKWNTKGYLSSREIVRGETFTVGNSYYFAIKEVKEQSKLWPVLLSRKEPALIKAIITNEAVDVANGTIEINAIARDAGFKTKVAVSSNNPHVDPVGSIIGQDANILKTIQQQIGEERLDVVKYSNDKETFIANAIGINNILGMIVKNEPNEDPNAPYKIKQLVTVIVTNESFPKIIGRQGKNIRLISKLVQANIDVKSIKDAQEQNLVYESFNKDVLHQKQMHLINQKNQSNDEVLAMLHAEDNDAELDAHQSVVDHKPISQPIETNDHLEEPVDQNDEDDENWVAEGFEDLINN
ncbi:transcription termination factor NusA [Ureaplasma miroungigenitalium]|uniref:transcription termination factor NusA n=1 Tax=Ureaplasma miroungigenitalium TaxID=1042321 RepID=UPI0021E764DD|nr:transcription termination factor NusA [Ureaplasma miroungigenitalium]MCV3734113.1 transcription termination factor NusA [Ureaplasma miroungigenitalium]